MLKVGYGSASKCIWYNVEEDEENGLTEEDLKAIAKDQMEKNQEMDTEQVRKKLCQFKCTYGTKDHIEKIDFQDIFIAVVNWPISEFYRTFVCIMR